MAEATGSGSGCSVVDDMEVLVCVVVSGRLYGYVAIVVRCSFAGGRQVMCVVCGVSSFPPAAWR